MGLKEEEWQPDSTESRRGERAEETDFCSWPGPAPGSGWGQGPTCSGVTSDRKCAPFFFFYSTDTTLDMSNDPTLYEECNCVMVVKDVTDEGFPPSRPPPLFCSKLQLASSFCP